MSHDSHRELGRMALGAAGSLILSGGPERLLRASRPKLHGVQVGGARATRRSGRFSSS